MENSKPYLRQLVFEGLILAGHFCYRYTDIVLWEISLPPSILEIQPIPIQVSLFLDELKKWAVTGHEIFSNILEKLCSYETESSEYYQYRRKIIFSFLLL